MAGLEAELSALGELKENEAMSSHCSFRAGGPARYMLTVADTEKLEKALAVITENGLPWFLLGRGSNLLVSDRGFDGVVICLGESFRHIAVEGSSLTAGAAVLLSKAAAEAAEAGLRGLEFASGIPGSIGGAVAMNAGAYDGEIRDVLESATILFPGKGIKELSLAEMDFSYRHSILKEKTGILLQARFSLHFDEKEAIIERMKTLQQKRREKQPLELPSAGSTFKRPEGAFAGKLITDAGCKGMREGGAVVSEKHAGFIVNDAGATAADIYRLTCRVQDAVFSDSGIMLEREIILLGDFGSI